MPLDTPPPPTSAYLMPNQSSPNGPLSAPRGAHCSQRPLAQYVWSASTACCSNRDSGWCVCGLFRRGTHATSQTGTGSCATVVANPPAPCRTASSDASGEQAAAAAAAADSLGCCTVALVHPARMWPLDSRTWHDSTGMLTSSTHQYASHRRCRSYLSEFTQLLAYFVQSSAEAVALVCNPLTAASQEHHQLMEECLQDWADIKFHQIPVLVSHPHARVRDRKPLTGGLAPDELLHIWCTL